MKRCAWILLPALLGGCVNQEKEVELYKAVLEPSAPATTRPAARSFGAGDRLTLTEAMALANRDNERLAMAGEEYLQALIAKDRAVSAFLPVISLAPTYTQQENFDHGKFPSPAFRTHSVDAPVNLQASVNGVRDVAALKAYGSASERQRELLLDFQSLLLLETAQVYYEVLRQEKSLEVLSSSLKLQQEHVRDIGEKLKVGLSRQLDYQQAMAQAASTRVQLTDARTAVVHGRATLALLMGVPEFDGLLLDELRLPESIPAREQWLEKAQAQRHDLKASQKAVLAARQAVDAAIGQYYPSVSVNLDAYLYRESVPDDSALAAVIGVNLPIFRAGRIHADVRNAWSVFRQSLSESSYRRRKVRQEVLNAYEDYAVSARRLEDLQTQVHAAREAAKIADLSYQTGLATNLDFLDAQDRLLTAQLALTSSGFARTIQYLQLQRVTGESVASR